MALLFAIRDDDICYHTSPSMLHDLYGDILKVCPVSFSCIPFVGGFDVDNYPDSKWNEFDLQWREWQTKEIWPISKNRELVLLLRDWCEQGKATVMMHGIHHDLYELTKDKCFYEEIKEAKQYLESVFDRKVLVSSPPNNSLGARASLALAQNDMDILVAFGHRPGEREFSIRNYYNFMQLLLLYFRFGKRCRLARVLNFGTHKEQGCYGIGPATSYDELIAGFEYALERGGNFVVATHYYHLNSNPSLHEMLLNLVSYANSKPAGEIEFVTAERLFADP